MIEMKRTYKKLSIFNYLMLNYSIDVVIHFKCTQSNYIKNKILIETNFKE